MSAELIEAIAACNFQEFTAHHLMHETAGLAARRPGFHKLKAVIAQVCAPSRVNQLVLGHRLKALRDTTVGDLILTGFYNSDRRVWVYEIKSVAALKAQANLEAQTEIEEEKRLAVAAEWDVFDLGDFYLRRASAEELAAIDAEPNWEKAQEMCVRLMRKIDRDEVKAQGINVASLVHRSKPRRVKAVRALTTAGETDWLDTIPTQSASRASLRRK